MIWLEKYRPKTFQEVKGRDEQIKILTSYTLANIPHLILYGKTGHGKKTLLYCLINHLFNKKVQPHLKSTEIKTPAGKSLDVTYLESDEIIEITPSEYKYQDKIVIQSLIKQIAQTKPILSLFSTKTSSIKFVVITDAEDLTKDAQAALRRTVETYSTNFRIVLICEEISKIIEPIRSRCLCLRIDGFKDEIIKEVLKDISIKENIHKDEIIEEIVKSSNGNLRRALCLYECESLIHEDKTNKRIKYKKELFKLDWEIVVENIINKMKREQDTNTLIAIREDLYSLLNSCIPPRIILSELVRGFVKSVKWEVFIKICEYGSMYDERLSLGTKSIFHLEGFIASALCAINEN